MSLTNPWQSIPRPTQNFNVLRVDANHPLEFFWSVDKLGNYLFLCNELTCKSISVFPELHGIKVALPRGVSENIRQFALLLKDNSEWELFYAICNDIVECTRKATRDTGLAIILRRLGNWHQFLRKEKSGLLNEEQIKGLLGELVFIRKWLAPAFGWDKAISFWCGPLGTPQDFSVDDAVIEVKAQLSVTRAEVKISSAEQLTPQANRMHLHVLTFGKASEKNDDTYSLPDTVHEIRTILIQSPEALELFSELLLDVGYVDSQHYESYVYTLIDEKTYEVKEGFPRITTSNVPSGIVKINYNISLEDCAGFKGVPDWMEKVNHE